MRGAAMMFTNEGEAVALLRRLCAGAAVDVVRREAGEMLARMGRELARPMVGRPLRVVDDAALVRIARLHREGKRPAEIAEALGLKGETVRGHLRPSKSMVFACLRAGLEAAA